MTNRLRYVLRIRDQATLSWSQSATESARMCAFFNELAPVARLSAKPGLKPEPTYPPLKPKLRKSTK